MPIDGACLGAAFTAVACLTGVSVLAGIALARSFRRPADRRLAGRDRIAVISRGCQPVEVERKLLG